MCGESQRELAVGNQLSELARVEKWLFDLITEWELSEKVAFSIDLVVNEAVTNIINYAYSDDAAHSIRIMLTQESDSIVVEIVDDGCPFNPLGVPVNMTGTDLENAPIGGWGIHLMRTFSAEQSYAYVAGVNRLKLVIENRSQP